MVVYHDRDGAGREPATRQHRRLGGAARSRHRQDGHRQQYEYQDFFDVRVHGWSSVYVF